MGNKDWQVVDETVKRHWLLRHPFYRRWSEGTLSMDELRLYAGQYYHLECQFPRLLSRVHSRCEDYAARQKILENIIDEECGPENHAELWLRFADGLGLKRSRSTSAPRLGATQRCINELLALADDESWGIGLAAAYGYESQVPMIADTKLQGLKMHYGVSDNRSLKFFTLHRKLDMWHSAVEKDLILSSRTPLKRVVRGAESACRALWKFLDGVQEAAEAARRRP
jgi:pyrroloquinoline-quinone synthase